MVYKGKEIDESYRINKWKEEKIYSGLDHYKSFEPDEIKNFYLKALAKEKELEENKIEHGPVLVSISGDRGNDFSDEYLEICLQWKERESESEHNDRIAREKRRIDKEVEEEEQKRIREKLVKDGAIKDAIAMIEQVGGKVVFFQ